MRKLAARKTVILGIYWYFNVLISLAFSAPFLSAFISFFEKQVDKIIELERVDVLKIEE